MSGPIIKDSLYVVLTSANNFLYSNQLTQPITNKTWFRALCNNQVNILCDFARTTLVLDGSNALYTQEPGLVYAGDDQTWYPTNSASINKPTVSLYNSAQTNFDAIEILFQFI